jgi:hypothetical protein
MDNLAQVIRQGIGARGPGSAFVPFLLLLSSCGSENLTAPASTAIETHPAAVAESPPPDFGEIPGHPLADWTYADSLEELHAIWSDRFTLSATLDLDPKALWPYADAVMLDGASWGMAAVTTKLVYLDTDGHAYQRTGATHPKPNDVAAATPLRPEALAALGWATAQASPDVRRFDEGPGFRVAGPIRAAGSCMACHAYAPEQVVALLVYDFQEIHDD